MLAEWPTPAAAPELADQVLAAARREAWRREVVVDWSFNLAIAAGLAAILAGLAALAWLFGSAAGPEATSALVLDATAELLSRLRAQAAITGTAVLLLTTALAAWWWAER